MELSFSPSNIESTEVETPKITSAEPPSPPDARIPYVAATRRLGDVPPVMRSLPAQSGVNLVEAINLVARAVTAKIAYHEREIAALRAALRPFHEATVPPSVATNSLDADDAINQLLTIASGLRGNSP